MFVLTSFSVVPGGTVLFTTTRWLSSFFFSVFPISLEVSSTNLRLTLPSGFDGVPTVMNEMSVSKIASFRPTTAFKFLFFMTFLINFSSWG